MPMTDLSPWLTSPFLSAMMTEVMKGNEEKEGRWRVEGRDKRHFKKGWEERKKERGKKNSERRALVSGKKRAEPHYT